MRIMQLLIFFCALFLAWSCGEEHTTALKKSSDSLTPFLSSFTEKNSSSSSPSYLLKSAIDAYESNHPAEALPFLSQIMHEYPDTPWARRALFLTEKVRIKMDMQEEAKAAMLQVTSEYRLLADYAMFLFADYQFSNQRYADAEAGYRQLIHDYPKSSLVTPAAFQRGKALFEMSKYEESGTIFKKFLHDHPRSDLAPEAGLRFARCLIQQERIPEAVEVYRHVWTAYPGNGVDQEVDQELARFQAEGWKIPEASSEELFERGKTLYRLQQYGKAIETLNQLLDRDPGFSFRNEVLFRTGIASFHIGKRKEAASLLESMIRRNPSDPRVPEALYWIGRSYSKRGEWTAGIERFSELLENYPDSEWADDALFLTGNIYRETGEWNESLAAYNRLAQEYPESRFADSALWWQAWRYYAIEDYKKAERILQELVASYPHSFLVNQARYWQGKIAEKQGNVSGARAYYQHVLKRGTYTYYGYRAQERIAALQTVQSKTVSVKEVLEPALCVDSSCPDDPLYSYQTDDIPPAWTEETRKLLTEEPLFKKILELMHLNMKKEAASELALLQGKLQGKRGMLIGLSKAFFELGDYYRSHVLVLRHYDRYLEAPRKNVPDDLWYLAYPQAYWDSIASYSRQYHLDPYFIAAIIREESQFNAAALSPAGARGIMQVMPSTGVQVAKTINLKSFDRGKLFDPDVGINIGSWYMSSLLKRFNGNVFFAAAAYNAGPEAVAGWIKKNEPITDWDVFVESIPFSETRGYVKKILRNYGEYRRIYGKSGNQEAMFMPLQHAKTALTMD
ncbi:MAG: tetratricopeptide repeat protein [Nitrospirota bacterium]